MATPANHYVIAGSGIEGVVDTTSFSGAPFVSLQVDGNDIEGAELEETPHGLEVSALVESIPDLRTTCAYLSLPRVNIEDEGLPFAGVALLVGSRTSIGGPGLVDGVVDTYEVRPLGGIAAAVDF